MSSLIDKIEQLIKREKTTPERKKKDEVTKSSSEILSEIFSAFNADPPKIEDTPPKKSKKSKKKHKKEKKKRTRSSSSSGSASEDTDYPHKRKKRKKSKSKKRKDRSRSQSFTPSSTPVKIKPDPDIVIYENVKSEEVKVKTEKKEKKAKSDPVSVPEKKKRVSIKYDEMGGSPPLDAFHIPMPTTPTESPNFEDLRLNLECKKAEADSDKNKGKIQIKNLKFSAIYEETVKKAEEEAKKKAKMYEEGEYTDSSSSSGKDGPSKSQFTKTSDPSGILKQQAREECKM